MSSYNLNKGIGKQAEFMGLRSQYLFLFAGGLLGVFILFVVLYMIGVNQWVCIVLGLALAGSVLYYTFSMNARYGSHGLMKAGAAKKHPRRIISRKAIGRLIRVNNDFTISQHQTG